jgi:adenosylcobinamide-GDP ribazoletransferase
MSSIFLTFLHYIQFFTRLPLPARIPHAAPDFSRSVWLVPVAGAVAGAIGGVILVAAFFLHLPPALCATLSLCALVMVSGALHEDGLADICDGFGGGGDRDTKLAIMKDSRLGTFGTVALMLSLLARVLAIAAVLNALGPWGALACVGVTGAVSRSFAVLPLLVLLPARPSGIAASALRPGLTGSCIVLAVCVVLALLLTHVDVPLSYCIAAIMLTLVAVFGLCLLAKRQIGGHTGDVCGAAQQIAEICFLLSLVAGIAP